MFKIYVKYHPNGELSEYIIKDYYNVGDRILTDNDKGLNLGIIEKITKIKDCNIEPIEIKKASKKDYELYLNNLKHADKVLKETKKIVKKLSLNMNIIDAQYSLDKKILFFNFVSEERVDFRVLLKELASKFHTRIELHQIGIRDKAASIGGVGICGRILCCNNHLKNINSVNINMVKNQNIVLNPTKINGSCGRLLCCFTYENNLYEEYKKELPKIGEQINIDGKTGQVVELDILNKTYKIKFDDNTYERVAVK